ncbi:RND superfamily putative drug exporter [Kribbella orskensis]|uniref:RND superfamily putative drug exporter n=1 Tax=Kribbella orskensis TaxID=2512216 RepID=A0ABY2BVJ5_9ACTN|nr:MMPL family transporter [Kribbella orskensis]TCO32326.1 RND superfamily putative drug exporter [Kribbella orskensis]
MKALARTVYQWRRATLIGWIVALVGLAVVAVGIGSAFTDTTDIPDSESATAYSVLAEAGGGQAATTTGNIVWHSTGAAINSPVVRTEITALVDRVRDIPGVRQVVSPYDAAGAGQLNASASTAYARVVLNAGADVEPAKEAAEQAQSASLEVHTGGQAFIEQPAPSHGTEVVGILAALAILLLVFRSMWAALLPIITGVVGVGASMLLVVLGAHVVDLSATSLTMGALIGLGVGIDYALFIVNRYRKAVLSGASVPDAIQQALDTSGRAVIFAGITVVVALLGMFLVNLDVLTGMGQAAAVTVLLTVAAAITLLPALLGILGHKVLSRRQRRALAADTGDGDAGAVSRQRRPGLAGRWAQLVQRAPRRVGAVALLVLVGLAAPVASMRVGDADASSDPAGSQSRAYSEVMADTFGAGIDAPLLLVARTPDAAAAAAFSSLMSDVKTVEGVAAVTAAPAGAGQRIAVATVTPTTSAQAKETADLVSDLRENVIPAANEGTGLQVFVGGTTATAIDLGDALMGKLPLYLGLVALLGFLLLALAFRSVLVPLVGALSNLATILVGLGAITAIFQFGWGSGLIGVGDGAPVMYIVPVIIVGVVFGLSMDYQVFLVSRMHEEWTHTRDNTRAVRVGMVETGKVIAAAAAIMLCVFASFSFSGERIVSAIGIGLAIAVLIDAFVMRLTLLPALMTLIGRRNWSYPAWAERITPRLSIEGPDAESAVAPDAEPVAAGQSRTGS